MFLFTFLLAARADAETVYGDATVGDGDSLTINRKKIRLHGIDAPEMKQLCGKKRCGVISKAALTSVIANKPVRCVKVAADDRYGRMIAKCYVGDVELNRWMVSRGHAFAYLRYSDDYIDAEKIARDDHKGLWAGEFMLPSLWRRKR